MNLDDEKQARKDLADFYRKFNQPKHISKVSAGISIGSMDRLLKAHELITRQECVNAFIGLLASNRCLMQLPAEKVRKAIEEAVGIRK